MIDYHVHTSLCNHAEGTMEAYIQKAVDIGLKEICFLDHLIIPEPANRLSMTPGEVSFYFQAIQLLKHKYRSVIDIKAGLEVDFNPEHADLIVDIVSRYSFDVIGSSLHFLDGMNVVSHGSKWSQGENDTDYIYGLYLEKLDNMLDYNYYDIICHFDLLKKFGRRPLKTFDKEIDEILSRTKKKNLSLELNTSGYNHPVNEAYPSREIIEKCFEKGIFFTLGSDAHKPESVGQHYDKALPLLISAGYSHMVTFEKRCPSMIPIASHHLKAKKV
ncbi:MAG: histidinol-phosphatase [Proteobacteria bacterium]|nr:histidinol-phosphatase [Pseudomonadota bacterium]MCG2829963.1 histidinol-phosphatase [Desulfobacteraceae bacterium]MBU4209248.1 histidinol-phosphatase [Pseudomonadota bacterium]MBU4389191.1 histidinol-phosphatase [Pseudomonadota bacterium]MBU4421134.1 histidinol-phosphatase [Pseudomonadota bacterium]